MTNREAYNICASKARMHMKKLNGKLIEPGETVSGDYYERESPTGFDNRWIWLTSMITGMAPLLFQTENDREALRWANQFAPQYYDKVFAPYTQTMHDIGFIYLPYSVHLYQLTGDLQHRDTALRAADELAKRFDLRGRYIDAWSEMNTFEKEGRMIVDSSMNVALLFWAWKETGHTFYHDVAVAHLETIIRVLVRPDYSVAHAWFFDLATGEPREEANSCGYANGSHWARGTAWLVYGLAMAYSYTGRADFLETAVRVGEKYMDSLECGPVPVWDFRLPEELPAKICGNSGAYEAHWDESKRENIKYAVDTSAAAIMSCAFMLIDSLAGNERMAQYADDALDCLSNEYLDTDTGKTAMLRRSNGRDLFSIYGDYYYMLALAMKLYGVKTCWGLQ